MKYVTGLHALNLPCSLDTSGDWHASALRWEYVTERDTEDSIFGDYGIENGRAVPGRSGSFSVANHLRALLDLIDEGSYRTAQGAKNDFICNPAYHAVFFEKVWMLRKKKSWDDIDRFMHKEFGKEWRLWKNGKSSIAM